MLIELGLEVYSIPFRSDVDSRLSLLGQDSVHLWRAFVHSIRLAGLFLSLFRRVSYRYKFQKWLAGFVFHIQIFRSKSSPWSSQQNFFNHVLLETASSSPIQFFRPSYNSLSLLLSITFAKRPELRENHQILHHRAQTANQPRQVRPHVLLLQTMTQDPRAIRRVAQQAQQEEQQTEPIARALALVLHNLRDARAEVQQCGAVAQETCAERRGSRGGGVFKGHGVPGAGLVG